MIDNPPPPLPAAPAIIVPANPADPAAARAWAERLAAARGQFDIIEWRADALTGSDWTSPDALTEAATVCTILGGVGAPIIATFRTEDRAEAVAASHYRAAVTALSALPVWAVDIEAAWADSGQLARQARAWGRVVIASKHDFTGLSPDPYQDLVELGRLGDIAKLALSAGSEEELEYLRRCLERYRQTGPAIVIAMGQLGQVSRTDWWRSGSIASFATLGYASAPGQITAPQLRRKWRDAAL